MVFLQPSLPSFSGIFEMVLYKTTAVTVLAHLQIKKKMENINFLRFFNFSTQTQWSFLKILAVETVSGLGEKAHKTLCSSHKYLFQQKTNKGLVSQVGQQIFLSNPGILC